MTPEAFIIFFYDVILHQFVKKVKILVSIFCISKYLQKLIIHIIIYWYVSRLKIKLKGTAMNGDVVNYNITVDDDRWVQ